VGDVSPIDQAGLAPAATAVKSAKAHNRENARIVSPPHPQLCRDQQLRLVEGVCNRNMNERSAILEKSPDKKYRRIRWCVTKPPAVYASESTPR
jgi:hypothetical protein